MLWLFIYSQWLRGLCCYLRSVRWWLGPALLSLCAGPRLSSPIGLESAVPQLSLSSWLASCDPLLVATWMSSPWSKLFGDEMSLCPPVDRMSVALDPGNGNVGEREAELSGLSEWLDVAETASLTGRVILVEPEAGKRSVVFGPISQSMSAGPQHNLSRCRTVSWPGGRWRMQYTGCCAHKSIITCYRASHRGLKVVCIPGMRMITGSPTSNNLPNRLQCWRSSLVSCSRRSPSWARCELEMPSGHPHMRQPTHGLDAEPVLSEFELDVRRVPGGSTNSVSMRCQGWP